MVWNFQFCYKNWAFSTVYLIKISLEIIFAVIYDLLWKYIRLGIKTWQLLKILVLLAKILGMGTVCLKFQTTLILAISHPYRWKRRKSFRVWNNLKYSAWFLRKFFTSFSKYFQWISLQLSSKVIFNYGHTEIKINNENTKLYFQPCLNLRNRNVLHVWGRIFINLIFIYDYCSQHFSSHSNQVREPMGPSTGKYFKQ